MGGIYEDAIAKQMVIVPSSYAKICSAVVKEAIRRTSAILLVCR
jgi:hypothetical protein